MASLQNQYLDSPRSIYTYIILSVMLILDLLVKLYSYNVFTKYRVTNYCIHTIGY